MSIFLNAELQKAQKKREKEFLEEQDKKDEWERVLTGKKREQEISIAELKGIGPLGDFWQSYLGKSAINFQGHANSTRNLFQSRAF